MARRKSIWFGLGLAVILGGAPAWAETPPEDADEITWQAVKDRQSSYLLDFYLTNYPGGRHHAEALAKLQSLEPAPPPVATPPVAAPPEPAAAPPLVVTASVIPPHPVPPPRSTPHIAAVLRPPEPPPEPAAPPRPLVTGDPGVARYNTALTQLAAGDEPGAVKTLAGLIADTPDDPMSDPARYRLGMLYFTRNEDAQALTVLNAAYAAAPASPHAPEAAREIAVLTGRGVDHDQGCRLLVAARRHYGPFLPGYEDLIESDRTALKCR